MLVKWSWSCFLPKQLEHEATTIGRCVQQEVSIVLFQTSIAIVWQLPHKWFYCPQMDLHWFAIFLAVVIGRDEACLAFMSYHFPAMLFLSNTTIIYLFILVWLHLSCSSRYHQIRGHANTIDQLVLAGLGNPTVNNFSLDLSDPIGQDPRRFDSTGMFYWCPAQNMSACITVSDKVKGFLPGDAVRKNPFECLQTREQAAMTVMSNHIVVCVFADAHSAIIGLRNLIMPLRASNFEEEELKHVVLVGDKEYMKKEWKNICNFPKITILSVGIICSFVGLCLCFAW